MKRNMLTAKRVEDIIRNKEFGRHHDGMGLQLVGSAKFKSFSWILRLYRGTVTGRPRDVGLGSVHDISLKEARAKAHVLRQAALDGVDPLEQRRKALAEVRAEASSRVTLGVAMDEFISIHSAAWKSARHLKQWRSTLADYASKLRSVPVSEIDAAVINETLVPVFARTPETARRVRERITRVIKWIADGRPPPVTGSAQKHHAALAYKETPAFMAKLRDVQSMSGRALEFTVLTAARTSETLGARWDEIDFDEKVWVVPAERMKSNRAHVVPLSTRVLDILRLVPKTEDLIFPSPRGGPMSDVAMLECLKRMDGYEAFTVHGFRSAFRDWSGDCTHTPRDVVEHALAHSVGNKTEAAYRRGSAIQKRRALMQSWADYCEQHTHGATVTTLRGRA